MSQVNAHLLRWRTPEEVLVRARPASIALALIVVIDAFTGFGGMLGVIIPLYAPRWPRFGLVGPNTQAAAMDVDPTRAGSISSITGASTFAMGAPWSPPWAAFCTTARRDQAGGADPGHDPRLVGGVLWAGAGVQAQASV